MEREGPEEWVIEQEPRSGYGESIVWHESLQVAPPRLGPAAIGRGVEEHGGDDFVLVSCDTAPYARDEELFMLPDGGVRKEPGNCCGDVLNTERAGESRGDCRYCIRPACRAFMYPALCRVVQGSNKRCPAKVLPRQVAPENKGLNAFGQVAVGVVNVMVVQAATPTNSPRSLSVYQTPALMPFSPTLLARI